jgi:hypothetical protein
VVVLKVPVGRCQTLDVHPKNHASASFLIETQP